MSDTYISNRAGHRINPASETHRMIDESGQKLTCTAGATDYNVTVVAGARYAITVETTVAGVIYLGIAAITADKDILWCVGTGCTIGIEVPAGEVTLHYGSDQAGTIGRLARIDDTR